VQHRVNDLGDGNNAKNRDNPQPSAKFASADTRAVHRPNGSGRPETGRLRYGRVPFESLGTSTLPSNKSNCSVGEPAEGSLMCLGLTALHSDAVRLRAAR
jgi:hypothetical protein